MNNPYEPPKDSYPFRHNDDDDQAVALTWGQIFFSFDGRIPRKVYWLSSIAVSFSVFVYAFFAGFASRMIFGTSSESMVTILLVPAYVVSLWCHLAIQIKRWHDRGKSGNWVFINLVPCIGGIIALVETGFTRGDYGPNQYGPDATELY